MVIKRKLKKMILLYYMGTLLEPEFGPATYLFLYLFSGVMGNAVSILWYRFTEYYAVSAGASGAIFGLVGAAAWLVIRHHGYYKRIGIRQIALMVLFSLVLAATGDTGADGEIRRLCSERGILANIASDKDQCDFYFPGVARKGPLVAGVTAGGTDHKKARELTEKIRELLKNE